MRGEIIGIIAEGAEDQGVLKTIFKAFGFDDSEIRLIRPALSKDATDNHQTIGTLQGVKQACLGKAGKRDDFDKAFVILDCKNIAIHIDTAEIDQQDFECVRPKKVGNNNYCVELRALAINIINGWLEGNFQDELLYAISIEEVEAWCLTIYEQRNTVEIIDSKNKLRQHLERDNLTYKKLKLDPKKDKKEYFEAFTKKKGFDKLKKLKAFANFNQSLKDFIHSIEEKFGH